MTESTHRPIEEAAGLEPVAVLMDTRFRRDVHREAAWRDAAGRVWVVARDGRRLASLYLAPSDRVVERTGAAS